MFDTFDKFSIEFLSTSNWRMNEVELKLSDCV